MSLLTQKIAQVALLGLEGPNPPLVVKHPFYTELGIESRRREPLRFNCKLKTGTLDQNKQPGREAKLPHAI